MSEPTEIELVGSGHVADPPILDQLVASTGADRFSVVFVPDDRVSAREKETVGIRRNSPEERDIAACLAEIAATLGLSSRTVDQYVGEACERLKVRNRVQAVAKAVELGLFSRPPP